MNRTVPALDEVIRAMVKALGGPRKVVQEYINAALNAKPPQRRKMIDALAKMVIAVTEKPKGK